ncbi:MAG: endonuclease/exonuclease/phosphatase family protein [Pigmentiphaga sp.]|uniref:endonuclease/exonuclease/phosphatase family protein n=1 Tax=Pigmentiphaga sp. TaxID=1977564 RepID=UPI0029A9D4B6|nr:endonuclease/exonuclease/phosphatase family protein [Pigmentiphaga sp.]MDX3907841.1 endonuclease/exonuclease/phosphatase family protein [Pigmentiphaga sp.]
MSVVRIVSYNIHKGLSALGARESVQELRLGLHTLRADLAFLQEVQGRNDRYGTLHEQHEMLAAALRLEAAYGRNAVYRHTDHGNALLSRFPILSHQNQDISDHRLEQRGLLHARVGIGRHEVHCFVVHLGLFAGSRSRQVAALVSRIEEVVPPADPILIAGDFNDWTNVLSDILIERLGVHEVFATAPRSNNVELPRLRDSVRMLGRALRGGEVSPLRPRTGLQGPPKLGMGNELMAPRPPRTFPAIFPWLRLDRIYQRGFSVRQASVLYGRPWTRLSDHAPLLAELELP